MRALENKSLAWLLACASLGLGACGESEVTTSVPAGRSTSAKTADARPALSWRARDRDGDSDVRAPADDTNNDAVFRMWTAPDAGERRDIVALIKRYYAAALARDGAGACSMIYSTFAESVPEDYGTSPPGQPYMTGGTCSIVLTKMFQHFRPRLLVEVPRLKVIAVRLDHGHGLAVLGFGNGLPERQIPLERERSTWKIEALLDGELP